MHELTLTYHGVIYSKKNSKRIVTNWRTRRPIIVSNRNAKNQEAAMGWEFREQAKKEGWRALKEKNKELADHQYKIEIAVWQKDLRRRDLDNQATAILDGLVVAGVIPDDSCDAVPRLLIEYKGVDRENPRAEIKITEVAWMV
jgi:Holliday junction resolvase RusA-like endonuclease